MLRGLATRRPVGNGPHATSHLGLGLWTRTLPRRRIACRANGRLPVAEGSADFAGLAVRSENHTGG